LKLLEYTHTHLSLSLSLSLSFLSCICVCFELCLGVLLLNGFIHWEMMLTNLVAWSWQNQSLLSDRKTPNAVNRPTTAVRPKATVGNGVVKPTFCTHTNPHRLLLVFIASVAGTLRFCWNWLHCDWGMGAQGLQAHISISTSLYVVIKQKFSLQFVWRSLSISDPWCMYRQ
jgi:hypothetical protein